MTVRRTAAPPSATVLIRDAEAASSGLSSVSCAAQCGRKLGDVEAEFEQVHNIERAREVGSVHTIIPADQLRPYLIIAVERGMAKAGGAAVG